MRTALKRTGMVLAGAAVLTLGIDYASMAATGSSLILGKTNKASKTTTIQNTKSGAALQLKTKSSASAPLKVNGKGKVVNLNADKVDGLDSTQLQRKLKSCAPGKAITSVAATGSVACGTLPRTAIWKLPQTTEITGAPSVYLTTATYPAGSYLLSSSVTLTTGVTGAGLGCTISRFDGDFSSNRVAGQTSMIAPISGRSYNSVTGTVTLTQPEVFTLYCVPTTGTIGIDQYTTSVSVVPLDGGSKGVLLDPS